MEISLETFNMMVDHLKKAWFDIEPVPGSMDTLLDVLLKITRHVIARQGPFHIVPGSSFTVLIPIDNFRYFEIDPVDERVLSYLFEVFATDVNGLKQVSVMFDSVEFYTLLGG